MPFDPFAEGAIPEVSTTEEFDPFAAGAVEEPAVQGLNEPEKDPALISSSIPRARISELSKKYGVPEEALIKQTYMRGGTVEGETRPLEYAAALAGEALPISGGAAAAFAQKKMYAPEQRAAFDEISNEVDENRSYARSVGEIALGVAAPFAIGGKVKAVAKATKFLQELPSAARVAAGGGKAGLAAELGTAAGMAGTIGAGAGLVHSEEGSEVSDAVLGSILGAGLGAGAQGLARGLAKTDVGDVSKVSEEAVDEVAGLKDKVYQSVRKHIEDTSVEDRAKIDMLLGMELPDARLVKQRLSQDMPAIKKTEAESVVKKLRDEVTNLKTASPTDYNAILARSTSEFDEKQLQNIASIAERRGLPVDEVTVQAVLQKDIVGFSDYLNRELRDVSFARSQKLGKFAPSLGELSVAREEFGDVGLKHRWDLYREAKYARNTAIRSEAIDAGLANQKSWIRKAYDNTINPSRYVLEAIDRKAGTTLVPLIDSISNNLNKYKTVLADMQPTVKASLDVFDKELKGSNLSYDRAMRLIYKTIEKTANEEETKLANQYFKGSIDKIKNNFEFFRGKANELYGDEVIKKWEDYVPHQAMDFASGARVIVNETHALHSNRAFLALEESTNLREALKDAVKANPQSELTESLKKAIQIKEAIEHYVPGKKIETVADLRSGFEHVQRPSLNKNSQDRVARAANIRLGANVPTLIKERDLLKLQERWLMDTLKSAAIDRDLTKLRGAAKTLKAMKANEETADYVRNLADDLTRRSRTGSMNEAAGEFAKKVQVWGYQNAAESNSRLGKFAWNLVAASPEVGQFMASQMYPAVLSAVVNPMATLVNLTQPLMYSLPELGYGYGSRTFTKAYLNVARDTARLNGRGVPNIYQEMLERGHRGAQWTSALKDALDEATGGVRSPMARKGMELVNKINAFTMAPFSGAELANRAVSFSAGKDIAADFLNAVSKAAKGAELGANEQGAMKFFQRLPEGYKRQIQPMLSKLKELSPEDLATRNALMADIEDQFAGYIIAKTIFNYDKVSASNLARTVAPTLMTFTKFPLNVLGDIVNSVSAQGGNEGFKDISKRLLAPTLGLVAAEALLQAYGNDDEVILGMTARELASGGSKAGLLRYSNIASLPALVGGQWASPPVLSPALALGSALTGDWEKASKEGTETLKFFMPAPLTNSIGLVDKLAGMGLIEDPFE
jgi:hypothetical protein